MGRTKFKASKHEKKRASAAGDDDSSIDSKGNIRNLIDYEESEISDSSYIPSESDEEDAKELKRKSRKKSGAGLNLKKHNRERPRRKGFMPKRKNSTVIESDSDSDTNEQEVAEKPEKKKAKKQEKIKEEPEETEETEGSTDSPESEEVEEEETTSAESDTLTDESDEEEEEKEDNKSRRKNTIDLVFLGGGEDREDPNEPKKYKMKKESQSVRRFVELLQKQHEGEAAHIDNDITYFKTLPDEKQAGLLQKLENRLVKASTAVPLKFQILDKATTPEVQAAAMSKFQALSNIDPSSSEYYKCNQWINGYIRLPLGVYKNLPVRIEDGAEKCAAFVSHIQKSMDSAVYGQDDAKLQILQFVSAWIANPEAAGNVLSITGAPGVGKTSLVKEGIAQALGRPFHFITLGGATDASYLDGHSYTYEGSTWGKIVDVLIHSQCLNPVIYFDELDKVSETTKGEEIINLLVHLTDGAQNQHFQDKYFTGINLDLSRCLFIFSHNNEAKINPILRDRMYNISVNGFNAKEKGIIAEQYLLPAILKEMNLYEKVSFSKEVIKYIIENHTDGEPGVRVLKRALQTIVSRINLLRFYNDPKAVPFSIPGFQLPFTCTKEHIDIFLKKKERIDASIAHLYV